MHHRIARSSTSRSLGVSMLDIVNTFVCDPSDGLDVRGDVGLAKLFVDEGCGIVVVLFDAYA